MTTCHLAFHLVANGLLGCEPPQVERLLRWVTVAGNRNYVRKAHCMMAWIVETADCWIGKILDDGERRGLGRNLWQGKRPQVFFEMPNQCLTDSLAQEHSA